MSKRKNRTLARQIRARMAKTNESYTTARSHLLKSPKPGTAGQQQAGRPLVQPQEGSVPVRFAFHRLVAEGRLGIRVGQIPEQQAASKARLWERLERELARIASPRESAKLLETIKKKNLDDDQLERLLLGFRTLPTGFMRQLELIAQQIRQLRPIIEQAAAIRDMIWQAAEMWKLAGSLQMAATISALRDLRPTLDAVHKAIQEISHTRKVPDEISASAVSEILRAARRLLAEVDDAQIHRLVEDDAVSAALRLVNDSPVAAAMRLINDSPAAAAKRLIDDSPAAAASRRFIDDSAAAAVRRFVR